MLCPKCGNEIADHAKFCPKCGAVISNARNGVPDGTAHASPPSSAGQPAQARAEASAAVADKPKKKGKSKKILIAAAAVLAVLILIGTLADSPEDSSDRNIPSQSETEDIDPVQSQEADARLLAVIDQAQEAHEKAIDALPDLSADTDEDGMSDLAAYTEHARQWIQIFEDFLADLARLQEEANAISGLDDKMKSARNEYFAMLHDSRSAHIETLTFIADYLDFFMETIDWRPLRVDYDYVSEYADALGAWVQEAREGYAAISCPASMQSAWAQYGDILEYNASIADKLDAALQYDDMLRYYSTFYMTDRYMTVEENLYDKLIDCIDNENRHANRQRNIANSLAEEMHAYAELDQHEKDAYEFDYNRSGKIGLDYEAVDVIYPSLYNTYDAFVIIGTGCASGSRTIVVEAEIPGFTQKYQELFRLDSAYTAIYVKPPVLTGDLDLSSAKSAQINVTVSEQDGTLIDAKSFPVTIKSRYDFDWYSADYGTSTQDDILCFLTPEASAITRLKRQAIDEISAMSGGALESFVGYQEAVSNWNHYTITYLQAAGLMNALYEMGVRYNMDPFSISGSNQHILLPEDVIENRSGLCIETSLVIASALQAANMHAFLIFPPGHAQVAVEAWDSGTGRGEYFLIETTKLESNINNKQHFVENANKLLNGEPSTGIITYYDADGWYDYLSSNNAYVVDCDDARLLGLIQLAN